MAPFGEIWQKAFDDCKSMFKIQPFLKEQEEAIKMFFENKNVFVNLPTGFGKSLIYQCLPMIADVLYKRPQVTSVIVVISPLRSLMKDQVEYLQNLGLPAIAITEDKDFEMIQMVMNGTFNIVYGSPECLLCTSAWTSIFQCESFTELLIGVAIDEAHCIVHW